MHTDKYQKIAIFHFAKEMQKKHGKKHLRGIIFGNFGAHNLGDEAILAGEIAELQNLPNVSLTVVARKPAEVRRLHKVKAISLYKLQTIRQEVKRSDFVVIGGGGLINKIERSFIGFLYQLYMLFIFFYLPRFYRKKTYVLGIGIYDNANPFIVSLVLPFLRSASVLSVRDFHSFNFLKNKKVHSHLQKDNSYLMATLPQGDVLKNTFFSKNFDKTRNNIGISLVQPADKKLKNKLMVAMASFLEKQPDGTDFWFFPADFHPEYDHDEQFAKELLKQLNLSQRDIRFHFVPTTFSPQLFFSSFKLMNKMITMRFHASLFAYRLKVPFVGIPYDTKCTSLIESVGKTPISLRSVTPDRINNNIL